MLKLPEITYPLVVDSIGKMLALGDELSVHCNNHGCHRRARINLEALCRAKGVDHGCMEDDLRPLFFCAPCRQAGRPDRNISFISHSPTSISGWPRLRK